MGDYKKLNVWIKAKNMADQIYKITEQGSFKNDFRFKDQIRASAIPVESNIAEDDELQTNKQAINFFFIAKGSTADVII